MNETASIKFAIHGKVEGLEITPGTIGLSLFNEFNQQVETFIGGSQKLKLDQVHVEIAQSSYVLRALLPAVVLCNLEPDLKLMARQDVLGELDIKRAEVVQKWQARAKSNPELSYEVCPEGDALPKVRVSRETDYRVGEIVPWVAVAKYLFGQIVDMGGVQKANVHLKLERGGKTLLVGASQGYLGEQVENRLYHKALLHVRAEQHFRTGDLRNIQLIAFVDYQPIYKEIPPDILRCCVVLPFNWDDAQRAATLDWKPQRPAGTERDALKDDIKIIAQAAVAEAEFVITDDAESFFRYCKTFKDAGAVQFKAIKLGDGFDRAFLDAYGQRDFTDDLGEGNGGQS